MPTVSLETGTLVDDCAVSLPRYCQIIGIDENTFWGVRTSAYEAHPCLGDWTSESRRMTSHYLYQSQLEIENVLGYPVRKRWLENEWKIYTSGRLFTKFAKIIACGVKTNRVLGSSVSVSYTTEPAVVAISDVASVNVDDVVVFHVGTNGNIIPSEITYSGDTLTIKIPRCRLVDYSAYTQSETINYDDDASFASKVDVVSYDLDDTDMGNIYWNVNDYQNGIHRDTQTIFIDVIDPENGIIKVRPAEYVPTLSRYVSQNFAYSNEPLGTYINYCAGLTQTPDILEDAIVRLAHALMPEVSCNCSTVKMVWNRDSNVPENMSWDRYKSTFGTADGAWMAWQIAQSMKKRSRGGLF